MMSDKSDLLRRTRIVAIVALIASVLLMAGAEWWRARVFDDSAKAGPPDISALCRGVGAESLEQLSEVQFTRVWDLFATHIGEHTANTVRRLYAAVCIQALGAMLCFVAALPLVLSRAPERAVDVDVLNCDENPCPSPFGETGVAGDVGGKERHTQLAPGLKTPGLSLTPQPPAR